MFLWLAAMEPEFNSFSPEEILGTRINTLVHSCRSFIFFSIKGLFLAWKITGWTRKGKDGTEIGGYFTDFLVFQRGRKLRSVVTYTFLTGKMYQSSSTPEIEKMYLATSVFIKTKQSKRQPRANLESNILEAKFWNGQAKFFGRQTLWYPKMQDTLCSSNTAYNDRNCHTLSIITKHLSSQWVEHNTGVALNRVLTYSFVPSLYPVCEVLETGKD